MRILIATALLGVASIAGAATLEEAEARIREAWAAQDLYEAVMAVEAAAPTGAHRLAVNATGKLSYMRDDDGERYRSTLRLQMPEPMRTGVDVETVFDGSALYVFHETLGQKRGRKAGSAVKHGVAPPGGGLLLDELHAVAELALLPDATLDEAAVYVVEGSARGVEGETPMFERLTAYIDQESGALRKLELYERGHVKTATISLSDLNFDPALDPASFVVDSDEVSE